MKPLRVARRRCILIWCLSEKWTPVRYCAIPVQRFTPTLRNRPKFGFSQSFLSTACTQYVSLPITSIRGAYTKGFLSSIRLLSPPRCGCRAVGWSCRAAPAALPFFRTTVGSASPTTSKILSERAVSLRLLSAVCEQFTEIGNSR